MRRPIAIAQFVLSACGFAGGGAIAMLGVFAFWDRYWRVRDCFNELGRCYDAERQEVLLEQAGVAWSVVTAGGLVVLALGLRGLCRWKAQKFAESQGRDG